MSCAVIYQSKYGSAERYAKWIAEDLGPRTVTRIEMQRQPKQITRTEIQKQPKTVTRAVTRTETRIVPKMFLMEKVKDITMDQAVPTMWGALQWALQRIDTLESKLA